MRRPESPWKQRLSSTKVFLQPCNEVDIFNRVVTLSPSLPVILSGAKDLLPRRINSAKGLDGLG